jgi:hypothetical protein
MVTDRVGKFQAKLAADKVLGRPLIPLREHIVTAPG